MPNHCFNQLVIQSIAEDILDIMEFLEGGGSMIDLIS